MRIHNPTIWILIGMLSIAAGCQSDMVGQSGSGSIADRRPSMFGSNASAEMPSASGMAQASELERRGQTEAALNGYARIAEANPDLPVVWHRLAVAYDKLGNRSYADACYERALALDPMNAEGWCDFGYGRFLQGDSIAAERAFRRSLELNSNLQRAHNNLGLVLARSGNTAGALEQFRLAGCDTLQATQNLELATAISIPAQTANPAISAPSAAMADAANPPAVKITVNEVPAPIIANVAPYPDPIVAEAESQPAPASLVEEISARLRASHARRSNSEIFISQNQHVEPMSVVERQMDDVKINGRLPVSAPTPAQDQAVIEEATASPIVRPTSASALLAEKTAILNLDAVDPSVAKSELPPPQLLAPVDSAKTPEWPTAFSESMDQSFVKPDSANVEPLPDPIVAEVEGQPAAEMPVEDISARLSASDARLSNTESFFAQNKRLVPMSVVAGQMDDVKINGRVPVSAPTPDQDQAIIEESPAPPIVRPTSASALLAEKTAMLNRYAVDPSVAKSDLPPPQLLAPVDSAKTPEWPTAFSESKDQSFVTPGSANVEPLPDPIVAEAESQPAPEMPVEEISPRLSASDARLSNTEGFFAQNQRLVPMSVVAGQMDDVKIKGRVPVSAPTPDQDQAIIEEGSAPPIVRPTSASALLAEKIAMLNRYAIDPSVAKSDLPPPQLLDLVESAKTAEWPKAFSESNEPSFVKPGSANVEPLPDPIVAEAESQPAPEMPVEEISARLSASDARLSNNEGFFAQNQRLVPMSVVARQMDDVKINGRFPFSAPTPDHDQAIIEEGSAPPIVRPTAASALLAEKIAMLNRYAVDPSVAKSDLPLPQLLAPVESAKTAEWPKAFSESNEPSFVKPGSDSERGVYTLITDLQNVRESSDTSGGQTTDVVRRIGDIDE